MTYYAIQPGGSKLGPATVDELKQWAAEGKITTTTMIEDAATGDQVPGVALPGLFPEKSKDEVEARGARAMAMSSLKLAGTLVVAALVSIFGYANATFHILSHKPTGIWGWMNAHPVAYLGVAAVCAIGAFLQYQESKHWRVKYQAAMRG